MPDHTRTQYCFAKVFHIDKYPVQKLTDLKAVLNRNVLEIIFKYLWLVLLDVCFVLVCFVNVL